MMLEGLGHATSWQPIGNRDVRGAAAAVRLAELVQLALQVDAAIIDLHQYRDRQRALGAAERLTSASAVAPFSASWPSALQPSLLADPVEAMGHGFGAYASVPMQDDETPLGRVVILCREKRDFSERELAVLRKMAEAIVELVKAA